jgi:hypothetical protein
MSAALVDACPGAAPHEVGEWVEACAHETLSKRAARIAELENVLVAGDAPSTPAGEPTKRADDGPRSQVSSLSVYVPGPDEPKRRPATRAIAAALIVAAFATSAVVFGFRRSGSYPQASTPAAASAPPGPAMSDPPPTPAVFGRVPQSAASASTASTSAAATAPSRPVAHKPAGAPVSTGAPVDCNPPYVRGPDGRKIWKRECLAQAP